VYDLITIIEFFDQRTVYALSESGNSGFPATLSVTVQFSAIINNARQYARIKLR